MIIKFDHDWSKKFLVLNIMYVKDNKLLRHGWNNKKLNKDEN